MYIPALKEIAIIRIESLSTDELSLQISLSPTQIYTGAIMKYLSQSKSYYQANELIESLLRPLIPVLTVKDIRSVVRICIDNNQVYDSGEMRGALEEIFTQHKQHAQELRGDWIMIYIGRDISRIKTEGKILPRPKLYKGLPIRSLIEETFPEVLTITNQQGEYGDE